MPIDPVRIFRSVIACAVVLFCTSRANAGLNTSDWQFDGFHESYEVSAWNLPPSVWLEAHSRLCAEVLGLTPDQAESLEGLVAGAERDFMYGWLERKETLIDDELRDQMKPPEEQRDSWDARWKKMKELQRELHALRQKLHAQVLTDLRLVLTTEQNDRWPDLERAMRRSFSLLNLANMRMEGLDLGALVKTLDPPDDVAERIAPTLAQYSLELDPLIAARDQAADALETAAIEARDMQETMQDPGDARASEVRRAASKIERASTRAVRAGSSVLDASKRIADLNAMYLARLQHDLPESIAVEIAKIAETPLYTRRENSWSDTPAHAALHLAENLSSFSDALSSWNLWSATSREQAGVNRIRAGISPLTDDQRARIKEIRVKFETEDHIIKSKMEPEDETDPSRSNWVSIRTPTGYAYLSRIDPRDDDSDRHEKREAELRKKQAELTLSTLKEVREVLDPQQRILIAAFMW